MVKKKLDQNLIKSIVLFENVANIKVFDGFYDNFKNLIFVVPYYHLSKAIGKQGINVKRISKLLKTNVIVLPFTDSEDFYKKTLDTTFKILFKNNDFDRDFVIDDEKIVILVNKKTKGLLIGRDAQTLNNLKLIIKRLYNRDFELGLLDQNLNNKDLKNS